MGFEETLQVKSDFILKVFFFTFLFKLLQFPFGQLFSFQEREV